VGHFSIKVIDAQDRGIPGALVCVQYGFWGADNCVHTDKDGWVTLAADAKLRPGFIIINHEDIGKIPAEANASYTIRI
jgi:hypothetical protein